MKSIIQKEKKCFITGSTQNLHSHHILFGKNRGLSERYGLKVWLTWGFHEGDYGVHGKYGHELDKKLKIIAQESFNREYPDLDFIKIFGKNYL